MLLVKSAGRASLPTWQQAFAKLKPGLGVRWWDDPAVEPRDVKYVIVWEPERGRLATFPNLELIFSSSAGVDHILADADRPLHLPIVRMGSAELAQTVAEYVAMTALMALRGQPRMAAAQQNRTWDYFEPARTALGTKVGLLGLGAMGSRSASMLAGLGFQVLGWSRTPKVIPGATCHSGPDGLAVMLPQSEILVSLLPETPETRHLIDRHRLQELPRGASIINAGRGSAVRLEDLVAAVDTGQIRHAFLDVFETEPLPSDHPIWHKPGFTVTSHLAGYATVSAKAAFVADVLTAHVQGLPLPCLYVPVRGY